MNSKETAISAPAAAFVDSVLRLQPKLAAFDCDGTLWTGDAGEGFFKWELARGLIAEDVARWVQGRYAAYREGKVSEDDMCGEMVTIHRGLREADVLLAAGEYFEANIAWQIFPEMQQLVRSLLDQGCEVWAVSSTNEWVIRAAMKHFGIAPEKILAAKVEVANGVVTDHLIRVPSGEGKPRAIREVVKRDPEAVFGNSRWDADMLKIARHAFAVNPNPDLEAVARGRGWTVYFPEGIQR
ncbi:MAG TPA: haloacid dehalogenase-like hydrolase [Terriglobales bacterium]|nr:haloacid dehalogenase-like hydrolase [Terriglobales bacterium]